MNNEPIEILERDLDDLVVEATQGAAAETHGLKSVTQRLDGVLAPVLAKRLQQAIQELDSIKRMCGMISEGEWAEHGAQGPLAQLTEATFTMLVGEANAAKRDAVDAARWRFTRAFAVRPDLVARLEQFYGEVDVIQARPRNTEQAYDQSTDDLMALAIREGAWSESAAAPCLPDQVGGKVGPFKLGLYGKAFDAPGTRRAYTYDHQPNNMDAHALGSALIAAHAAPRGDAIDAGLSLLLHLQSQGFGVFEIGPQDRPTR